MSTDKTLQEAIELIANSMAEVIKERATKLVSMLTADEEDKLIRYDQCIRSAKVLCLAAIDAKEGDVLYYEFGCEAIKSEVKSLRRIKKQTWR
jgi:hypothetical protein